MYECIYSSIDGWLSCFSEDNPFSGGKTAKVNKSVDERWQRIFITMPGDHCVVMPSFAIVNVRMSSVLLSLTADIFCVTWKLTIHNVRQAVLSKILHHTWQQSVTSRIILHILAIP